MPGPLFLTGAALAAILVLFSAIAFKRGRLGVRAFVAWTLLSLVILAFSLSPGLVDWLARLLTVEARGLLVLTVAVTIAYLLIWGSYLAQRRTERTCQRLAQEIALLRYELEHSDEDGHASSSRDRSAG